MTTDSVSPERLAELIARYERGAKYDHAIDVLAALRELAAARQARAKYAKANPLGGPASMFRVMAERIEAGEEYHAVLADYGLAAPPVAAEGWQLVPKEPTEEMIDRAWEDAVPFARGTETHRIAGGWTGFSVADVYRAMLAAAPKEPK